MCIRDRNINDTAKEVKVPVNANAGDTVKNLYDGKTSVSYTHLDSDDDQGVTEEEAAFFEEVQRELIAILQDRTKPIGVRVDEYLDRANEYQKKLSQNDVEKHIDLSLIHILQIFT